MTKALAQTYTTVHTYRVMIMRVLCVMCALATLWYGINVYSAISRTIAAENISKEASALSNSVNQLGSDYIKLSHSASPSALSQYGMNLGQVTAYIPRTTSVSVALSSHEL
ncbi:MAG: hypothetical protein V4524_00625 [Patescibacteria group bacterium]